jgi:hypothetical protein
MWCSVGALRADVADEIALHVGARVSQKKGLHALAGPTSRKNHQFLVVGPSDGSSGTASMETRNSAREQIGNFG